MASSEDEMSVLKNIFHLMVGIFATIGLGTAIYWGLEASRHLVITWK